MSSQSTLPGQGLLFKQFLSAIPAVLLVSVICLATFTLWPGMTGPLVHDDHRNLAALLTENPDYHVAILENQGGPLGRPVTMISFAAQRALGDSLEIREMKVLNLVIHLFNALLIYFLLANVFYLAGSRESAANLSVAATALWVLNPVNTETVLYVIQRATLLSATFMLLACLCYLHARLLHNSKQGALIFFLASVLCWVLAIFSKENAIILPLLLVALELCLFETLNTKTFTRWGLILGVPLGIMSLLFLNHAGYIDYSARPYTMLERLYTQAGVLGSYFRESFAPFFTETGIFRDDVVIQRNLFEIRTILALSLCMALLVYALIQIKSTSKLLALGILLFFLSHLVESTIIPLELYYRHRNYFPSIGTVLFITYAVYRLLLPKMNNTIGLLVLSIYLLFLAHASYFQSRTWSSYDAILLNAYKYHPFSVRLNLEMSGRLVQQGDINTALQVNGAIINARPTFAMPLKIQRYYLYCERGQGIPEMEYQLLDRDINLFKPHLTSNALDIFLRTYRDRGCNFINLEKILKPLMLWSDSNRETGSLSTTQLWDLDYYLTGMLILLGREQEAISRLKMLAGAGGEGAAFLLSEVGKTDKIFQIK